MGGANIEIRAETGEDNMLTLRLLTAEIDSIRSKMKYGEYKVHDDRFSEAIDQIRNNIYCDSDTSGSILIRNTINPHSSGLLTYTTLTFLFLIEIKNNCQIGIPKILP